VAKKSASSEPLELFKRAMSLAHALEGLIPYELTPDCHDPCPEATAKGLLVIYPQAQAKARVLGEKLKALESEAQRASDRLV
jgi:hypothetical protein